MRSIFNGRKIRHQKITNFKNHKSASFCFGPLQQNAYIVSMDNGWDQLFLSVTVKARSSALLIVLCTFNSANIVP